MVLMMQKVTDLEIYLSNPKQNQEIDWNINFDYSKERWRNKTKKKEKKKKGKPVFPLIIYRKRIHKN